MTYTSEYPIFYVTVDMAILTIRDEALCALVVKRGGEPFKGCWALPGGFVEHDETLHDAAARELEEETGVATAEVAMEQLATFGDPDRDPRARVVSVAWLAVVPEDVTPLAGSDASEATWKPVDWLLSRRRLAFDHADILEQALERTRSKLEYTPLAAAFVADEFTVADLRRVYEVVWGHELDPGNFHRKVTGSPGFVTATGRTRSAGPGRPAELFRAGDADALYPPLTRRSLGSSA